MDLTHRTHLDISETLPEEIDVGAIIPFKVMVKCSHGCDLRGRAIELSASDHILRTVDLRHYLEGNNETDEIALQVPKQVGDYTWRFVLERHQTEHITHDESSLIISFKTIPHKTSLAIWHLPSPVPMNNWFKAKVGVKCSASCSLSNQLVEIRDETGTKTGEGIIGETRWHETNALYWAEAEIKAPSVPGVVSWVAKFAGTESELAHDEASVQFSFRADKPADHRITMHIIGEDTRAPLANAEVRLGFYTTTTNENGYATLHVPKGTHELQIWTDGYKAPPRILDVNEDATIEVAALKTLTAAEVEQKTRRFEASLWG
jgi:hypothetical protein